MRGLRASGWVLLVVLLLEPLPLGAQWRTDRQAAGTAFAERTTALPLGAAMTGQAKATSSLAAGGLVGAVLGAGGGFALGAILTNSAAGGIVGAAWARAWGL